MAAISLRRVLVPRWESLILAELDGAPSGEWRSLVQSLFKARHPVLECAAFVALAHLK
jgi:hypothetical protein